MNTRAGWGFMVLTNMLPNQGNGTYLFYMHAQDRDGNTTLLGTRTITCANASATKPFGAIDTPTQGGTASGASFVNFGWALTPQPKADSDRRVDNHRASGRHPPRDRGLQPRTGRTSRRCSRVTRTLRGERGGRLPGNRHDDDDQRDAHDLVDGGGQPGRDRGNRESVLHGVEWSRRTNTAAMEVEVSS